MSASKRVTFLKELRNLTKGPLFLYKPIIPMINRQRKRAQNVIRCFKNVLILHLIRLEKLKVNKIRQDIESTPDPEFVSYEKGKLKVLDSISKNQLLKIEFEQLMFDINSAKISFRDYNDHLDLLLTQSHTISFKVKSR